jgi:hypothetical protein
MKVWASLIFLITLSSCLSLFQKKNEQINFDQKLTTEDYSQFMQGLTKSLMNNQQISMKELKGEQANYINTLAKNIFEANSLLFKIEGNVPEVKFYIIKDPRPFYFSLPGYQIFVSNTILKKFVQNESYLICLLTYELFRSRFNIYPKVFVPPVHYGSLEKIISFTRIAVDEKIKLHEWSAYAITRARLDHNLYIQWIQLHNRSYNEFNFHYQDRSLALKEELMLKKFVIKNFGNKIFGSVEFKSSPQFYSFLGAISH